ncbi:MAG: ABC transporter ATP-binding protein [candidate division WOR-3 bacterium]|nr:ABC transporter ATP-binding protein [candidate division WOR-3 bacterium]
MFILAENISEIYTMGENKIYALRDVSFSVEKGEYVAVTGPSGSGKSTLLHILGCLDIPTDGTYKFQGRNISDINGEELSRIRLREIGFVFQFFNLLPRINVVHNVELPLIYAGVSKKERRERALSAIERVGLISRSAHNPQELSGGERQRVAIARAIVAEPELILADEPTGNLDSKTGEEIIALFGEMHKEGKTVIIVTHESSIAKKAERVIRLLDGRIE